MTERSQHVEHDACRCRRCKCVRFTNAVEVLLKDGAPRVIVDKGSMWPHDYKQTLTVEEAALLFESSVRELHEQLVRR